jgi:transposase-like protein
MAPNPNLLAQPLPAETRQRAKELFFSGETLASVARELQLAEPTVRSWAKRSHWVNERKLAKSNPDMPEEQRLAIAKSDRPLFDPLEIDLAEKRARYSQNLGDAAVRASEHVARMDGAELIRVADKLAKIDAVCRKNLKLDTDRPAVLIDLKILSGAPVRPAHEDDGKLRSAQAPALLVENE